MIAFDAILVPGGGLTSNGTPQPWVVERLKHAATLRGEAVVCCLSGFTPHKAPPLDDRDFPIAESVASAKYLHECGVPADRLLLETCSLDTIGNAWFSRLLHADVLGWTRLLVVTSKFHMPRTQALFETIYSLPAQPGGAASYQLHFAETPDVGMTDDELTARVDKEQRALEGWRSTCARLAFRSLRDVHRWLFTEHECYAPGRVPQRQTGLARETY